LDSLLSDWLESLPNLDARDREANQAAKQKDLEERRKAGKLTDWEKLMYGTDPTTPQH